MKQDELIESLLDEDESFKREELEQMDSHDLVDAWMQWNGFIGWTDQVIDVVFAAYEPISLQIVFDDMDEDSQPGWLAQLYEGMTAAQKDEFLRLTGNE